MRPEPAWQKHPPPRQAPQWCGQLISLACLIGHRAGHEGYPSQAKSGKCSGTAGAVSGNVAPCPTGTLPSYRNRALEARFTEPIVSSSSAGSWQKACNRLLQGSIHVCSSGPRRETKTMSSLSSKQDRTQGRADPLLVLASIVAIFLLVLLGSRPGHIVDPSPRGQESSRFANPGVAETPGVTFASDERYWDANCSRGWGSRPQCDQIASRAQWCGAGTRSVYCSEYTTYMEQFHPHK